MKGKTTIHGRIDEFPDPEKQLADRSLVAAEVWLRVNGAVPATAVIFVARKTQSTKGDPVIEAWQA
jgi:hypothetical protein